MPFHTAVASTFPVPYELEVTPRSHNGAVPTVDDGRLYCNESSRYEYSNRKSVLIRVHHPVS
jgi:hypothetical protein